MPGDRLEYPWKGFLTLHRYLCHGLRQPTIFSMLSGPFYFLRWIGQPQFNLDSNILIPFLLIDISLLVFPVFERLRSVVLNLYGKCFPKLQIHCIVWILLWHHLNQTSFLHPTYISPLVDWARPWPESKQWYTATGTGPSKFSCYTYCFLRSGHGSKFMSGGDL